MTKNLYTHNSKIVQICRNLNKFVVVITDFYMNKHIILKGSRNLMKKKTTFSKSSEFGPKICFKRHIFHILS